MNLTCECEQCGTYISGRKTPHVCAARPPQRIVIDHEGNAEQLAYQNELTNAVAEACDFFDSGWGVELAISIAMQRIAKAAERHGWYRACACSSARGVKPEQFTDSISSSTGDIHVDAGSHEAASK